jgi:hypothetical protein
MRIDPALNKKLLLVVEGLPIPHGGTLFVGSVRTRTARRRPR